VNKVLRGFLACLCLFLAMGVMALNYHMNSHPAVFASGVLVTALFIGMLGLLMDC